MPDGAAGRRTDGLAFGLEREELVLPAGFGHPADDHGNTARMLTELAEVGRASAVGF
ncbi:hypothetical protein [Azospirillum sp. B510]|uniref:hypothetical protein n=1 Tax=Azospirillum sp. (strain B510) TaxID=137722 RepID=UPI00034A504E|nr:hypothetical protein [Azospirillum sp. B510]